MLGLARPPPPSVPVDHLLPARRVRPPDAEMRHHGLEAAVGKLPVVRAPTEREVEQVEGLDPRPADLVSARPSAKKRQVEASPIVRNGTGKWSEIGKERAEHGGFVPATLDEVLAQPATAAVRVNETDHRDVCVVRVETGGLDVEIGHGARRERATRQPG